MQDACTALEEKVDGFDKNRLKALVDAYNADNALEGPDALQFSTRGVKLTLPPRSVATCFNTVIAKTVTHLHDLLARTPVDAIVLVGGFAQSPMLQTVSLPNVSASAQLLACTRGCDVWRRRCARGSRAPRS